MPKHRSLLIALLAALLAWGTTAWTLPQSLRAEAPGTIDLPAKSWTGTSRAIDGEKGEHLVAIGYPVDQKTVLTTSTELPIGQYRLRLRLRASHVNDEVAWADALLVKANGESVARLPAIDFARQQQAEERTVVFMHRGTAPLRLELSTALQPEAIERVFVQRKLKTGDGPQPGSAETKPAKAKPKLGGDDLVAELTEGIDAKTHVYFVLEQGDLTRLSSSAIVSAVEVNKIRYLPGETLRGQATIDVFNAKGAKGKLVVSLEHGLNTRTVIKEIPVEAAGRERSKQIDFEFALPERELGHAVVAEFVSADGRDRSEQAEYFNIATDFNRVAIFGGFAGTHGGSFMTREEREPRFQEFRQQYCNAAEHFAWAEEDMVEMSPADDVWFSGQTCYRMSKPGLKAFIAHAHEHGIAQVSYAKFVMSGYLGWKTAWEYPWDHRGQFGWPIGMWERAGVPILERFRFKEFAAYEHNVATGGELNPFWQDFMPINPNPTPQTVRIAAEEVVRSVEMFGWDGIRWDGQPRGGGSCGGGGGDFSYAAARKTQSLVRYFKDIIGEKLPKFGHGYNYLFIQDEPNYDWAYEDFELDELSRGGGLLMNESIGNTTGGRKLGWLAHNIQVEGDLARERGGYLLGISYADQPRDQLVESILYYAGGCRPMGGTTSLTVLNRYATRYSKYTFDETLRRLAQPEKILAAKSTAKKSAGAAAGDHLPWWESFVYETRPDAGSSQLVVNLINIPRDETMRSGRKNLPIGWNMPAGTDPFMLGLSLPAGYRATAAHWIDPFTLTVTPAPIEGGQISVQPVDAWRVLIVDMAVEAKAKTLAEQFGPPSTFHVERPGLKERRNKPVLLDVHKSIADCERDLAAIDIETNPAPPADKSAAAPRELFGEEPELDALDAPARNAALIERKQRPENSAATFIKNWPTATLVADQKLAEPRTQFGKLAPRRDGVVDAFFARGPMAHRLDVEGALALLPQTRTHEAQLDGGYSGANGLRDNIPAQDLARFDLAIYTDIPHQAIGPENAYALVDWVKAGGGALFTGGQYSFGKGGYAWTVLDRELLPVQIVENLDVRIARQPLTVQPGEQFADLGVQADFKVSPALFTFNQVALRDGAQVHVFLKSGNRPLLVGWQLGKGRVACLLMTQQGLSSEDRPLFCEWADWPRVLAGVLKWLTPGAAETAPQPKVAAADVAAIVEQLAGAKSAAALDDLLGGGSTTGGKAPRPASDAAPRTESTAKKLDAAALEKRIVQLEKLLTQPNPETIPVLAEQALSISNLPPALRLTILRALGVAMRDQQSPAASLTKLQQRLFEIAAPALTSTDTEQRCTALKLLALARRPEFMKLAETGHPSSEEEKFSLDRALITAITMFPDQQLKKIGERKMAAWQATEESRMRSYTGGSEFTLASPPLPLLDSESLAARVGWLAYLSRFEPKTYAADFAHEWAMLSQYGEYCGITEAGIWQYSDNFTPAHRAKVRLQSSNLHKYHAYLSDLRELTRPHLEAAFAAQPVEVAAGFARLQFHIPADMAVQFIAPMPPASLQAALPVLEKSPHPVLSHFATMRMQAQKP